MQNSNQAKESFRHFSPWLIALFITAFGAQLWVVWLYGSPIPIWDQWYQADLIFRPCLEGNLHLQNFFAADSNHRIVVTHLFDMAVIWLNGRWDPLLQMTINAFIHATFACGLVFCLWKFFGQVRGWLICFLLMPFFALPYGGENAIWGINSLWYFVNIFALTTIVGLGFSKIGSWKWWLGIVGAILSLLTMASGLLAPLAVGGLILLRAIKNRRVEKENWIGLVVYLILATLGLPMLATPEYNRPLQAHSIAQFTAALTHNLNWPFQIPGMIFVISLPLVLLLIFYLRPNFRGARAAELILALALWSVLQSVMIAYGRGNYVQAVAGSRYMDVFNVFVIASFFATVLLAQCSKYKFTQLWNGLLLPFIFAAIIFCSLCKTSRMVVDDVLIPTRQWNLIAEERVEEFFKTGDEKELFKEPTVRPDPKITLKVLRDEKLQTILPPVCLANDSVSTGRFSSAARWLLKNSVVILSCGLILFVALCVVRLTRASAEIIAALIGLAAIGFIWSEHSLNRESVERNLHLELSGYFKSINAPERAAIHERKAKNANSSNQFAN